MTWTAPTTRTTGELITASIWNTDVVDNLAYLFDPNGAEYVAAGTLTTTSTSFTDIDGTNMKLTVSTTQANAPVTIGFSAAATADAAAIVYFDIDIDGTREGETTVGLHHFYGSNAAQYHPVGFVWRTSIASAGSHIFKMKWKVSTSTGRLDPYGGQFWMKEG